MHIPDGFLAARVWLPTWIISIGGLSICIRLVTKSLKDRMVPLMGVTSAFIFAAQMLNFPVIGGTSGHLLGGLLAAVMLGPYGGALVISIVLIIQCLIFQDGGLTALGTNILNMSFIGTFGGYYIYAACKRFVGGNKGIIIGTAIGSWVSVVLASSVCAMELAISGISPLKVALLAMASVHALIGIGEAIVTTLIIKLILRVRPDLIYTRGNI